MGEKKEQGAMKSLTCSKSMGYNGVYAQLPTHDFIGVGVNRAPSRTVTPG